MRFIVGPEIAMDSQPTVLASSIDSFGGVTVNIRNRKEREREICSFISQVQNSVILASLPALEMLNINIYQHSTTVMFFPFLRTLPSFVICLTKD